jgi:hypothetical protein
MGKRLRRQLARIVALISTQYFIVAVGTASATAVLANKTGESIVARLDAITHALDRLH